MSNLIIIVFFLHNITNNHISNLTVKYYAEIVKLYTSQAISLNIEIVYIDSSSTIEVFIVTLYSIWPY